MREQENEIGEPDTSRQWNTIKEEKLSSLSLTLMVHKCDSSCFSSPYIMNSLSFLIHASPLQHWKWLL